MCESVGGPDAKALTQPNLNLPLGKRNTITHYTSVGQTRFGRNDSSPKFRLVISYAKNAPIGRKYVFALISLDIPIRDLIHNPFEKHYACMNIIRIAKTRIIGPAIVSIQLFSGRVLGH